MLKLKADPTFVAKVLIQLAPEKVAEVEFEFRHMTPGKLSEFLQTASDDARPRTLWHRLRRFLASMPAVGRICPGHWRRLKSDADYLMEIVAGWRDGVDVPFDRDAVVSLCERYPNAPSQIVTGWAKALVEHRLKN